MLNRTHLLFTFNPLLSSPFSNFQGMESVQGGLRSGFGPEAESKTVPGDELNGGAGDDFCVDELLDLSSGFSETEEQLEEPQELVTESAKMSPVFLEKQDAPPPENGSFSGEGDFGSLHESGLSVQAEGLESLEWLSHFVEDSFSDYSAAGGLPPQAAEDKPETTKEQPCFSTPVQTKARTKRARAGVRVWPVLSPSFTESSSSQSSSTSSTTSFLPSFPSQTGDSSLPAKKQKMKTADGGGAAVAQPRRCSHCGVTKTPQWRAGPRGSKTLCNACGVRYKSGRLLPEYRPACSPTFSNELHSNHHRKVLEMRRKKELEEESAGVGAEFLKSDFEIQILLG